MTDGIDIKGAVPTVMIAAALGAGAALFTDRGSKKAVTYGLIGAGVGAFAHLVLGVKLGSGGHAVGQGLAERITRAPSMPPSRMATWPAKLGRTLSGGAYEVGQNFMERPGPGVMRGGRVGPGVMRGGRVGPGAGVRTRTRGGFGVGFDGDDFFDDDDVCPLGYTLDVWGNCVPVVFSIEREILYLYPEIVIQYPELRLHPEHLFRFRPELRQRYANVRSASEMRARYQQVHHQPPPARPKDAPPASKAVAPAGGAQAAPHGKHGAQQAAAPVAPTAVAPPHAPPHAPPSHAPPSAPPAHAALTPPSLPMSPTSKQAPPQTPPQATQHAATGWYTPGWQRYFPPIAYEYNHYGPMEYWWVQPDSRFALY